MTRTRSQFLTRVQRIMSMSNLLLCNNIVFISTFNVGIKVKKRTKENESMYVYCTVETNVKISSIFSNLYVSSILHIFIKSIVIIIIEIKHVYCVVSTILFFYVIFLK